MIPRPSALGGRIRPSLTEASKPVGKRLAFVGPEAESTPSKPADSPSMATPRTKISQPPQHE
jgi:hypothetical protein